MGMFYYFLRDLAKIFVLFSSNKHSESSIMILVEIKNMSGRGSQIFLAAKSISPMSMHFIGSFIPRPALPLLGGGAWMLGYFVATPF